MQFATSKGQRPIENLRYLITFCRTALICYQGQKSFTPLFDYAATLTDDTPDLF